MPSGCPGLSEQKESTVVVDIRLTELNQATGRISECRKSGDKIRSAAVKSYVGNSKISLLAACIMEDVRSTLITLPSLIDGALELISFLV